MSIWAKVNRLPDLTKQSIYDKFNETFVECKRFVLVSFEECEWSELDSSNPDIDKCEHLINSAKVKLNGQDSLQGFVDKIEIENSFHYVRTDFGKIIDQVHNFKTFLDQVLKHQPEQGEIHNGDCSMEVNSLESQANDHQSVIQFKNHQERIINDDQTPRCLERNKHKYLEQFQYLIADLHLKSKLFQNCFTENCLDHSGSKVLDNFNTFQQDLLLISNLLNKMKDEWKLQYKMSLLNYPFINYIDEIGYSYECVIKIILENKSFLFDQDRLTKPQVQLINKVLDSILQNLISNSFIIEEQPCIVNKNKYMKIKCRFFIGPKLKGCRLSANVNNITLKSAENNMIIEQEKNLWLKRNLDIMSENVINLDNLKLNGFKRTASGQYVTQQMSYFTLDGDITLTNDNLDITTTFHEDSLPVSIISHSSQDVGAWGALIWSYHFDYPIPQNSIEVTRVRTLLNDMFVNRFGFGLKENNLDFLVKKLMGNNFSNSTRIARGELINVKAFARGKGKILSFWDYFYNAYKLTSDHLQILWKAGLIVGFISRPESQKVLSKCPTGTFLLRFSESEQGGICITYYHEGILGNLMPIKIDTLVKTNLVDLLRNVRIKDEPDRDIFTYIYTANGEVKYKHNVLQKYYTCIDKQNENDTYCDGLIQVLISGRNKTL